MIIAVTVLTLVALFCALLSLLFFRRKHPLAGAIFGVLCLLFALADVKAMQIKKMVSTPFQMPPTTVSSAVVKEEDWSPVLSAVGSISAVQGAMVSSELDGTVAQINFQNGGVAKAGDVLVRMDTSSEEAQLRTAEADLELARANLDRARDLAQRRVISSADLDTAQSTFKQKQGAVDNMRAIIAKKQVRAPFAGQLGIRQVNVGQMVKSGQQVVSLQTLDPVYCDFALPQQYLPKLSQGLEVHVHTDAVPGRVFDGKLTAINSAVDQVTRNVSVQGTLENHDGALRPGMFAKVDVVLPDKHPTLVVPGTAIAYAPYGDSVYIIEKKKDEKTGKDEQVLRQVFVRVGQARGDFVEVTQGVKAGETVVSTGVFKLRNGMPVVINNDLAPNPQLNPKPADT
ncbi:MAG: efflux RND transporter periplasmic adaptor subunit [Verrucomicrobia bacterium]|nr:efflux RND transporter periplasmic adaptor subunit [Verrucomicrobiota bacterium]